MTGAQAREARRLLGSSFSRLERLCSFPRGAVQKFETTNHLPPQRLPQAAKFTKSTPDRMYILRSLLEAEVVVFTDGKEPGVKLRKVER